MNWVRCGHTSGTVDASDLSVELAPTLFIASGRDGFTRLEASFPLLDRVRVITA